mmetsp:Transcript_19917/g.25783  ORF Transcript_19917/g.25783 Transcript_19917/m.25783 type:complete len:272 (+) Transcript_19917:173-988(+)|eukprot:CAMPEP_0117788990 /NCGR_PEP_ID=MMETSP0948-20121206/7373_1 /TAXON_ID=44440 /ORGANISM="Chattonella subsalsa, Strain CCMP2191" /LENGTH=271 /DNA_ID=CAMNT_0005618523 /DNA_START=142 /DNA_END=957 /DNA_ORIENTATION=+
MNITIQQLQSEGNELFCEGRFAEAEEKYTQIIDSFTSPDNLILSKIYCNRSATRHKLGRFEEAAEDAHGATLLNAEWGKGWARKAICLQSLGRSQDAFDAIKICVSLDPSSKEFKNIYDGISESVEKRPKDEDVTDHQQFKRDGENVEDFAQENDLAHFLSCDEEWTVSSTKLSEQLNQEEYLIQISNDVTGDIKSWTVCSTRPGAEEIRSALWKAISAQSNNRGSLKAKPLKVTFAARLENAFEDLKSVLSSEDILAILEQKRVFPGHDS